MGEKIARHWPLFIAFLLKKLRLITVGIHSININILKLAFEEPSRALQCRFPL